jgi:hypothetical protein
VFDLAALALAMVVSEFSIFWVAQVKRYGR